MNSRPGTSVPVPLACSSLTTIYAAAALDAPRRMDLFLPGSRPSISHMGNALTTSTGSFCRRSPRRSGISCAGSPDILSG